MMNLWKRITAAARAFRSLENPAVPMGQAIDYLLEAFGAAPNAAGETVNARTALRLMAVYACVRVIAETAGSLPVGVFKRRPDGTRDPDPRHPIEGLLHNPNPLQTGQVFQEQGFKSHLLFGNTYARLIRDRNSGKLGEIWPLHPDQTRPFIRDHRLHYETTGEDGRPIQLYPEDVLHVPLLPNPGELAGDAPVFTGAQAIGLGMASEKQAARHFAEGALGPMGVEAGGKWDDETFNRYRKMFDDARKGGRGVFLFEGGTKPHEIKQDLGVFLDIRRFQVLEACRLYGVPPFMVGESDKGAPKSALAEQEREFANHTLRPILKRHEAELDRKLFRPGAERVVRYDLGELLAADTRTTWWSYSIGRQMGWLNVNEIRLRLGLPGIGPAGDQYLSPVNLDKIPRALEELLDGELSRVAGELEADERRTLLEASDDGIENLGDRADRFFEERLDRVAAGLADAGERFARSKLIPLGLPVDLAGFRQYCETVAGTHRTRAVDALRADPLGWIAGGRLEYDPGEAVAAIIGGNGHAKDQSESAPVGAAAN